MVPPIQPLVENGLMWEYQFDQGQHPHCTLYAISRAICNAAKQFGYRLFFQEIFRQLMDLITRRKGAPSIEEGWYPDDFDRLELPLVHLNSATNEEHDYGNIRIQVTELDTLNVDPHTLDDEYILVQARTTQDHCMHVICALIDDTDGLPYFLCRENKDSGPRRSRYVMVYKDQYMDGIPSNTLFLVTISIHLEFNGPPQLPIAIDYLHQASINEVDFGNTSQTWAASYVPFHGRTLQCISYAISECYKELEFYVHPNVIRSNIIRLFQYIHTINLMETPATPEKYNKKILTDVTGIDRLGNTNTAPEIEVKVQKVLVYRFDQEIVLSERPSEDICYYVLCKSCEEVDNYFVCRDIATVVGSKEHRLPKKDAGEAAITLYKVHIKNIFGRSNEIIIEDDEMGERMDVDF